MIDLDTYNLDLLINYADITPWHMNNEIESEIQNAIDKQLIRLNMLIIDLVEQLYLSSATWGLIYWEQLVALEPNWSLTLEERRSRIKARLRSKGTTTVQLLKNISSSFANGEADIIEHYDEYYFVVKFISKIGIPTRIDELEKAINLIKPAHLDFKFEFKFRTWGELTALGHPWQYYIDNNNTYKDWAEKEEL